MLMCLTTDNCLSAQNAPRVLLHLSSQCTITPHSPAGARACRLLRAGSAGVIGFCPSWHALQAWRRRVRMCDEASAPIFAPTSLPRATFCCLLWLADKDCSFDIRTNADEAADKADKEKDNA